MIEQTWNEADRSHTMKDLGHKLSAVSANLANWGENTFGSVHHKISYASKGTGGASEQA
jgi:hypothetical protein